MRLGARGTMLPRTAAHMRQPRDKRMFCHAARTLSQPTL